MSQFVETPTKTFKAGAAIVQFLRVKLTSSKLAEAGAEDGEIGTIEAKSFADGDIRAVRLATAQGTAMMVANGTIAAGATVYGASGGKVGTTVNSHLIGVALEAAGADDDIIEVLRNAKLNTLGDIDGPIVIDDDFLGDYPAAASALSGQGPVSWAKLETNGLGVIHSDEANGVLKFVFDNTAEAATATLFMENSPFDIDKAPIFEARVAIFDIGDDVALDIDIGLASDDHATDFEAIAAFVAFHLDGNSLDILAHSDDGTTDVAAVDTTKDAVDNTYFNVKIDCTDKADIKMYLDMDGNGYVQVLSGTTFTLTAYSGSLTPIIMVEKTSDNTLADVRVDRIRCSADRN